MRKRILFLLMIILMVPFVSAEDFFEIGGAVNKISAVVKGWKPGGLQAGISVTVFVVVIFIWIKIAHNRKMIRTRYRREGYIQRGWWQRHKDSSRKIKQVNQVKFDERFNKQVDYLQSIEHQLDEDKHNLDNGLYDSNTINKRFMLLEKKIGPSIIRINKEIEKLIKEVQKRKIGNIISAQESIQRLYAQFMHVAQKHSLIMERLQQVIQREETLVAAGMVDANKQEAILKEEGGRLQQEKKDLREEVVEASKDLKAAKATGNKPAARLQKKKGREVKRREKAVKREWKGISKDEAILWKEIGLQETLRKRFIKQEKTIQDLRVEEGILATMSFNAPQATRGWHVNRLEKLIKFLEKNSRKINREIEKLRKMDRRDEKLEKRVEELEKRSEFWTLKEEKVLRKTGTYS